ncbi:MAG: tRNA (N6-threonylcarbamoyladenosine(37)-N6)-methyltransferase TrmO [Candidatus Thiodiazotropha sp. (ex Ctena orbiculata)]|uniref:tRNA (N6-threonylcarbamoyladenosine(37)-N6)-methyltransferase TrmO n=1 Tax=Candidatus Thiodiazotropha taylori TaxID=2792791 RepID=A0A944M6Y3_9GAMM|nr:tRNA (N6-threonylcarbamoyladenosine(37)-N6)-methyltransferase TrmO [Candidatus Thiodiazotropha taylori]MBV2136400.1 tRNA (N6-threonylcarbamoyladenosine(37)-N6)-methyltransferase TrmO [Candidatus Thiodiazotropha taylori]PUB87794.1 MAG: tRNA (N6-threonylcarbamoyladenosine(37)-N6)-methyltransferase TrmO [gamma proteobacterium symbiont of Ctena orbiculata]
MAYEFHPIGLIHSCFKEKFGIPRQSRLITEAEARLEILPPYNRAEAFRELADYSHLWILFVFHATRDEWRPRVRPPRLGGNQRIGVFASRSPVRPNPIGLSVVDLLDLELANNGVVLHLGGVDLLDGTPVLDIKPYLPYADAIPDAKSGFAPSPPGEAIELSYAPAAEAMLRRLPPAQAEQLKTLIRRILENDPRPAYLDEAKRDRFGMRLYDFNIRWEVRDGSFLVTELLPLREPGST